MNATRTMERETERRHAAQALALPDDVVRGICDRAVEAVASGEPHKVTGGWVVLPYAGRYPAAGLLHLAWKAVKEAQAAMSATTTHERVTIHIERRDDVAGRPRYGYWAWGVLRPGVRSQSCRTWSSKTLARSAARREYPTAKIGR